MIEIIPSKYAREVLQGKRVFTDSEKATLIWNSPVANRKEKLDSLEEMERTTSDLILKRQIQERLEYEKTSFEKFTDNQNCHYVFVVFDEERDASGYFSEYELAREFGIKICEKYKMKSFLIEKQLLFGEKTKSEVVQTGYDGRENAGACYNSMGEMKEFYSNEVPDRMNMDAADSRARFEYRFFEIPAIIEDGTVAKIVGQDTYVVTGCSMSGWDSYMNKASENPLYYDFFDIQTLVQALYDDGTLDHMHVNPMYLEPKLAEPEAGDEKEKAYFEALFAVGEYFKKSAEDEDVKALEACRKYADICARDKRKVFRAKSIEDVLG